jgi:hypothetical protein
VDEERVGQRCKFDDPGVGSSQAPQRKADGRMEDLRHRFEEVLQGVLEGMWSHIQDEIFLEKCVGVLVEWQTLIHRATIAGEAMIG